MELPESAPPNQYIVVQYSRAPAARRDAYERLKHECLRGAEAAELLKKLRDLIEITGKEELEQTVTNYTQQMLLSAVRVSERQCPELQKTLASAQAKILAVFGTRAETALKAQLYLKQDVAANASSLALPSGDPVVFVTDALVRLLSLQELELVLLHELAHIVYTDSETVVAMKMKMALLSDSTLAGMQRAQSELSNYNVLQAGFELTADRAMLECAGAAQWPNVLSMFAKLAGGAVSEPLNGDAFLQQLSDTQSLIKRTIVYAAIAANPHPPLLYRVQELQKFMQLKGRSRL
jgi:Zn-dependent protease with chaperone function